LAAFGFSFGEMPAMPALTDTAIRNAKPADKPYKLRETGNLYLLVAPTGGKLWRLDYRFDNKRKLLALGRYPDVSLEKARKRRDEARKLLVNGVDPGAVKKAQKAARKAWAVNSFEVVAREWFEKWKTGKAESHYGKVIARLEKDVLPWLGRRPVAEIAALEVLAVLRRIESRGTLDTAHRAGGDCSQIFRYAIATGRATYNPVPDLRGALPSVSRKHFAALTDPVKFGRLLRDIDACQGQPPVRAALRLLPLLFVRPGELRGAKWADIDLEKSEWRYVASKTKTEHLVPLARQAVAILRELYSLTGRDCHGFVFPGLRSGKSISDTALGAALRALGYDTQTEVTPHGFRATARTLLAEELHFPPEVIEHQLAHRVPDTLGTAYDRTRLLKERRKMMAAWANYLDRLKAEAEVIPLRASVS
jgi:integrase